MTAGAACQGQKVGKITTHGAVMCMWQPARGSLCACSGACRSAHGLGEAGMAQWCCTKTLQGLRINADTCAVT